MANTSDADKPSSKLYVEGDWKAEAQAEKEQLSDSEAPSDAGIHVDDDWKAQAQAEKQRLAEQAEADPDPAGPEGQRGLPPADFKTLISTMVTQAMFAMGAIPDPQTGQRVAHLDLARHHIDMIGVIEEKTKGNLDEEEQTLVTQTLHELRMHYIELSRQAAAQGAGGVGMDPGAQPQA